MFRIQRKSDETWLIIDRECQAVFAGTLRECEDWLDQRENVDRLNRRVSWWARLLGYFRRSAIPEPGVSDDNPHAANTSADDPQSTPAA